MDLQTNSFVSLVSQIGVAFFATTQCKNKTNDDKQSNNSYVLIITHTHKLFNNTYANIYRLEPRYFFAVISLLLEELMRDLATGVSLGFDKFRFPSVTTMESCLQYT